MSLRLVVATGNPAKLRELTAMIGPPWQLVAQTALGIAPVPETGTTFVANALLKACHAAAWSGLPAIADDSGLEVDALGGRPGVHSARYAGPTADDEANNRRLLAELDAVPDTRRSARYRCALVFVRGPADPEPLIVETTWEGRIAREPRGQGGFGYDPLFMDASGRTGAELPPAEKNRLSHRGKAWELLRHRLSCALRPDPDGRIFTGRAPCRKT